MCPNKQKTVEALTDVPPAKTENSQFSIVGIGASAGGLEALELFFMNMPKDNGMAFVIIQHLDPNHFSLLPELLQRITPLKVYQVSDNLLVKQNCIYVIPPNKSISLLNGVLHSFDPVESSAQRLPVDAFFRSLANDRSNKSIGVILSGMGSDGSLGLKAIKEKNGIVLVQTPSTAKYDGMPRNATEAVMADIVAPAEELPGKLIELLKYIPSVIPDPEKDDNSLKNLDKIIILIREQSGHDFSFYRKTTLFRRIERRMAVHLIDKLANYVRFCQNNLMEVEILFKELLIGVTSFFRDKDVWKKLTEQVLPDIIGKLPADYVIRAWVTACSTGEEAYSLAIAFKEACVKNAKNKNITFQIFASDLNQEAIDNARKGLYSSSIATDVSSEFLNRYFTAEADGYRVIPAIRDKVMFATHNVIKDPPFSRLDIISCRNMLIYMEPELQEKIIVLFNYSLKPGGILVLGTSETLGKENLGFQKTDFKFNIFTHTSASQISELKQFPITFNQKSLVSGEFQEKPKVAENFQTLADQFLFRRFAPASILINPNGDIIYMTGRIGNYLELVAGKANWNIYSMARDGLRKELSVVLRSSLQNYDKHILHNINFGTPGDRLVADVKVQRIDSQDSLKDMIMVIFTDITAKVENELTINANRLKSRGQLKEMKIQLQRSEEDLQVLRKELQISQEEMKFINEELISTNEELLLTNDELNSSMQNMQSLNEELHVLNFGLQSNVNDFVVVNDGLKNLLNSTGIAMLFLDKKLKVRKFTDQVTNIYKLRNTDIGRPFNELASHFQYPEIESHARQVLQNHTFIENEIATNDGRWFNVKIMPYHTRDNRIDGLVLTFTNITLAKKAQQTLTFSEIRYRRLFESAKDGILIIDAETGMIIDVNPFLIEMLGYSKEQFTDKSIWGIGFLKDIVANKDKFLELQQNEMVRYENLPLERADGQMINVEFVSNVYLVSNEKVIQCIIREVNNHLTTER